VDLFFYPAILIGFSSSKTSAVLAQRGQ